MRRAGAALAGRLRMRLGAALARRFPERRVFIRSDDETRFVRLAPATQALALAGGTVALAWTIFASAVLVMGAIGAGNLREQAAREQALYETRLNEISDERDARAAALSAAHERYDFALAQVSRMQSALLASEERRRELETGIEVIQTTLRRTIRERDTARADLAETRTTMQAELAARGNEADRAHDLAATLAVLADTLDGTAAERDAVAELADAALAEADELALDRRLLEERTNLIFARLEEAVTVSMEPLDRMFEAAGLSSETVINTIRRGYSGTGGPLTPLSLSTRGAAQPSPEEARANQVLARLDEMNLYRLAAEAVPVVRPTASNVRFTSGFGSRRDPITGGWRTHEGLDFSGPRGTPILATANGTVVEAGWHSGYGNRVVIRHEFGIETLYAHMTRIHVSKGQRVSRGDRIGDMGSTGRSTGTHLHYEVHLGGRPVNPMTYIRAGQDVF
ncbi:MAG: peptidoglycan DD-metalloendopeptidase family protein [Rhodobacteraceae bacterium]|nr:peptidoglycan DD-metalloendopeptidase family protein [Paracoccaceae bacterium]